MKCKPATDLIRSLVVMGHDGGVSSVFEIAISPDGNIVDIQLGPFFRRAALQENCRIESFGIRSTGDIILITPDQLFGLIPGEN